MRYLKPLVLSVALATGALSLASVPTFAQSCTCAEPGAVSAEEAPPPLPVYDQPPMPDPGYMWTPGYWAWNNYEYYWVPGTWVEPPQPGVLWTPGYWGFVDGVYMFHRGYWGPHVGFYGGVYYGFGYSGAGYEGGRWDGGRFYYNRTVNNFGTVNVTNVYEQPVRPADPAASRASFNGPNGVTARPTTAEVAASHEPHIAPTTSQVQNARVASRSETSFVSANHGKPAVAATSHAGVLKGAAVVPAKAAGEEVKTPTTAVKPASATPEAKPATQELKKDEKAAEPTTAKPAAKPETKTEERKPEAKPAAEKPKAEERKPEERKPEAKPAAEKPKAEERKPEERKPEPKAEERKPAPHPAEAAPRAAPPQPKKPEKPCGRPGEPACPK